MDRVHFSLPLLFYFFILFLFTCLCCKGKANIKVIRNFLLEHSHTSERVKIIKQKRKHLHQNNMKSTEHMGHIPNINKFLSPPSAVNKNPRNFNFMKLRPIPLKQPNKHKTNSRPPPPKHAFSTSLRQKFLRRNF